MKMNLYISRILLWEDSSYKYQFCIKLSAPSKLVTQVWAKDEDEAPDVTGSYQNIETSFKNKLRLTVLKDLCFKSTEKLVKDYEFLLSILNVFTIGTEEYYPRFY